MAVFILISALQAQTPDSSRTTHIQQLQTKLDSLQIEIDRLRENAANPGDSRMDTTQFDAFLAAPVDTSTRINNQRSRRSRLDALLEDYMQQPGIINFNGNATAILQGSVSEQENIATTTGSFDLFVATNLGAQTLLFIDLEAIGGNGPNENINSFTTLNDDAGSTRTGDGFDRMHVLEAWVEFSAFRDAAKLTAGKIDLTNYFDNNAVANDETAQFISGAREYAGNSPPDGVETETLFSNFSGQ